MNPAVVSFRVEVLLSFQRALWDMVTPSLRGIAVKPVGPLIEARFIHERATEEEQLLVAEVEAYVVADFLPPVDVKFSAVAAPPGTPRVLEAGEEWVYLRHEEQPEAKG
jgi:hypothetical protein